MGHHKGNENKYYGEEGIKSVITKNQLITKEGSIEDNEGQIKKRCKTERKKTKMSKVRVSLLVITLNIHGLNSLIKTTLTKWMKNQIQYKLPKRDSL